MGRARKPRLDAIMRAARGYSQFLLNRNVLLVGVSRDGEVGHLQLRFLARHFLHLTGVRPSHPMSSKDFLRRCLDSRLSTDDILVDGNGLATLKLDAARAMFAPDLSASMFGEASGARLYVQAESYTGNAWACLGFVNQGSWHDPVTLLRSPVSTEVSLARRFRVVAVFSKPISESRYKGAVKVALRGQDDWGSIVSSLPPELAYLELG